MNRKKGGNRIAVFLAVLIAVFMIFSFFYEDLWMRTVWKFNLLDVFFEGRIGEYYIHTAQNLHNLPIQYVSGDFINGISWAIWNIPIWLFAYFGGIDVCENPFMYVWSELYLVFILFLTYKVFLKIAEVMNAAENEIKSGVLLFVFSPFVYIGIFYSGQTDVREMLCFLLSLYFLFKNKKGGFWFWAILSCWIKPFYLLAYVSVILLYNKDIFIIIGKVVSLFSLSAFFSVVFRFVPMYNYSSKDMPVNRMLESMLWGFEGINGLELSLLVLVLIFIYFMAYLTKTDKYDKNKMILCHTLFPLLAYFCIVDFEHYRMILLVPVMVLIIITGKKYLKINMILLTVFNVCGLICIIGNSSYCFNMRYIKGTVLERLLSNFKSINYDSGIRSNAFELIPNFGMIVGCAATLFVITCCLFSYINWPGQKSDKIPICSSYNRILIWINVYMIVPVLMLAFARL